MFHQHHPLTKLLPIYQNNSELPPTCGTTQRTYTFGNPYVRTTSRPENFEGDHLATIPALPNVDLLRDAFGMISLLRDAQKLI